MQLETSLVSNECKMNQLFEKNDLETIEMLFLIGQYQTALENAVKELDIFTTCENYYLDFRFNSLLIVGVQSLSKTEGKINPFIKKYYDSWENASFDVLHLSLNIHISKQNYIEAEEVALIAMDLFEKQKYHKPVNQAQYNKIVDLLILHVYIPNKNLDVALSLLKSHSKFVENSQKYHDAIESEISKNADKVKTHEQNRLSHSPDKNSWRSTSQESLSHIDKKSRPPTLMEQLMKWYHYIMTQAKSKGYINMAALLFMFVVIFLKRNVVFSLFSSILPQSLTPTEASNNLRSQRINRLTQ
jgi:hypothetical protein